jgi:hypothetical protein
MTALQDRMERFLREQENGTIITNPEDRISTFFRKMAYRLALTIDWLRRLFTRQPRKPRR